MSDKDIIRIEDPAAPDAAVVLDSRYFPVVVQIWIGQPTEHIGKLYYESRRSWFERARSERTKVVVVADLSRAVSPSATVRKALGDMGKVEDDVDELLGYATCVPNAILRGVVTALKWIAGDGVKPTTMVGSLDDAFAKARQILESHGINVPPFKYDPKDR